MTNRVIIDNLVINFGQADVLKGVSFTLAAGELVGLVGPAGSGKSTLLKAIAGLNTDYSGKLELHLPPSQQQIGMAFQNNALFDFLSVAENVAFPLRQLKLIPQDQIMPKVMAMLEAVELTASANLAPKELSGGMQRRVGIARAMVTEPALVLFDDPTAGLDPVTSAHIFKLIKKMAEKLNSTALIVSSDVDSLCHWAPRLLVLNEGQIIYDGAAAKARLCNSKLVREFISGYQEY